MNCKEINKLDPVNVLNHLGYYPSSHSGDEYLYIAHYRKDTQPSLSINRAKKLWYDHGNGMRGTLVDLLMLMLETNDIKEVINYCTAEFSNNISFSFSEPINGQLKEKKIASYTVLQKIQPIENTSLISYLKKRGISKKSWSPYLEEIHYKNKHGKFYAIGFKNDVGGYETRNSVMKNPICLGRKGVTTIQRSADKLIMLEGFMDFLSLIEMRKYNGESIIILNSTSMIEKAAELVKDKFTSTTTIKTFFDNDLAGNKATRIMKKHFENVTDCSGLYRSHNDINDYLVKTKKKKLTI